MCPCPTAARARSPRSVPFREVYIHALVRDANREKMSKTKGNVIDPIEIVKQYGTDAVRFTLASMASPGTDIAFNVARTEGYRAFANKIWNAARFIFMNVDRAAEVGITVDPRIARLRCPPLLQTHRSKPAGSWPSCTQPRPRSTSRSKTTASTTRPASIYQFFWGSFCDWYLEIVKLRLDFGADLLNAPTGELLGEYKGPAPPSPRWSRSLKRAASAFALHAVSHRRALARGLRWQAAGEVDRADAVIRRRTS